MRSIKSFGLAVVAVLALGAMTASAASAAHFVEKTGGALTELTGKATNTQVFVTKGGEVKCTKLSVSKAPISAMEVETQEATVQYESCTAFTIINATISPAEYTFHAGTTKGTGTVDIKKTITISAIGCESTVPAQSGLGKLTYVNKSGEITIEAAVTGIESSGTGTCSYEKEKSGTYTGNSSVAVAKEGGELEWKE